MAKLKIRPGIESITPYKAGLAKIKGHDQVIKLSSNENALGASPQAIRAYQEAALELFRYPDSGCTPLRHTIGSVLDLDPERIICGAGSDELIGLLCSAYAGPGDEILMTEHGFLMYFISALRVGATPVHAKEKHLRTDITALLDSVTDRTRIVFLANPNNPTGSYISQAELQELRKALPENILLVLDGAYAEYADIPDYGIGMDLVDCSENTVVLRTFSKIYGLASLRLGWAYCPSSIADTLNRVRGPFNVSGPAQAAGIAAIQDIDFTERSRTYNTHQREWLCEQLITLGLFPCPSIGNFLLIHFPDTGNKTAGHAYHYLMENGVILRPVANYGLPDYLRLTVGTEEENRKVVELLQCGLKQGSA